MRRLRYLVFSALACGSLVMSTSAQRDYLTTEEVELVRDAQQIDKRVDVLVAAIDRRFAVMGLNVSAPLAKPKGDWGTPPVGSRTELLSDINKLLEKAIDDIDNLAERPDSMVADPTEKKPKGYADLFPKAVRSLGSAAARYRPALRSEYDRTKVEAEQNLIAYSIDNCDEILAALAKLPAAASPATTHSKH